MAITTDIGLEEWNKELINSNSKWNKMSSELLFNFLNDNFDECPYSCDYGIDTNQINLSWNVFNFEELLSEYSNAWGYDMEASSLEDLEWNYDKKHIAKFVENINTLLDKKVLYNFDKDIYVVERN